MEIALRQAEKARGLTATNPAVGCVIVKDNKIIALSHTGYNGVPHAEPLALEFAGQQAQGADMYVTLEPCAMCAAAIANARLKALYFGAEDTKTGAVIYGAKIFTASSTHHKPEIYTNIAEQECAALMQKFFQEKRV